MNTRALRKNCLPNVEPQGPEDELCALSDDQRLELCDWMETGKSGVELMQLARKQFKIEADAAMVTRFRAQIFLPFQQGWRICSALIAEEFARRAEERPGLFEKATLEALQQKVFEIILSRGANAKDIDVLFSLLLKAKDQEQKHELAQQELELERQKLELAAQKQKADGPGPRAKPGGISPETLRQIEDGIRMM
ncbi:MAG TPA: hypothetical protein VHB20_17460 [Verrucomicrobiae bacterium]|jgi:hypothetical protein|nr:hypothetical protein [Verrucomicrobiae bacterium]